MKTKRVAPETAAKTAAEGAEVSNQTPEFLLQLGRARDAEKGEVFLNGSPVALQRTDFQFLYALAHLQAPLRKWTLFSRSRLIQEVRELFPRFEAPASVRSTGQAAHQQAFESILEPLLATLEIDPGSPSGRRWRHLLLSQSRRYAAGHDDASRYDLISELKQHRDLLGLMVQRFEQMNNLPPLNTPTARLHRFFVPEAAAAEGERRLETYVSEHLDSVRQALEQVLTASGITDAPPLLWGEPESETWLEATAEGYALNSAVRIELLQAAQMAEFHEAQATELESARLAGLDAAGLDPASLDELEAPSLDELEAPILANLEAQLADTIPPAVLPVKKAAKKRAVQEAQPVSG